MEKIQRWKKNNAKNSVVFIAAKIILIFNYFSAVQIYDNPLKSRSLIMSSKICIENSRFSVNYQLVLERDNLWKPLIDSPGSSCQGKLSSKEAEKVYLYHLT